MDLKNREKKENKPLISSGTSITKQSSSQDGTVFLIHAFNIQDPVMRVTLSRTRPRALQAFKRLVARLGECWYVVVYYMTKWLPEATICKPKYIPLTFIIML